MNEDTITIQLSEYKELCYDSQKLTALIDAGVDNWDFYEYALERLYECEYEANE